MRKHSLSNNEFQAEMLHRVDKETPFLKGYITNKEEDKEDSSRILERIQDGLRLIVKGVRFAAPIVLSYLNELQTAQLLYHPQEQVFEVLHVPPVKDMTTNQSSNHAVNQVISPHVMRFLSRIEEVSQKPMRVTQASDNQAIVNRLASQNLATQSHFLNPQETEPISYPPVSQSAPSSGGLDRIINPQSSSTGFIPEDTAWIQNNLSFARKPVSIQQQIHARQMEALNERNRQQQQTQLRLAKAQRDAIEHQQRQQAYLEGKRRNQNFLPKTPNTQVIEFDIPRSVEQRFLGENPIGQKSHFAPKRLTFNSDLDLTVQLWKHFVSGQGQPVAIDLSKLDFSDNINIPKLIPQKVKHLLLKIPVDKKALEKAYADKKPTVGGNKNVTHLMLDEPITGVRLNLDPALSPEYFAAFGRIAVDMEDFHIVINHQRRTVDVVADLVPPSEIRNMYPDTLDAFDFNPDPKRGKEADGTVILIHELAPPGSASFFIRRLPGNSSQFKKHYTFEEFFR